MAIRIRPVRRETAATVKSKRKQPFSFGLAFNGRNAAAQRAAGERAAVRVTGISLETEAGLRTIVKRAIAEGIPPYDAARTIRSMVGMTDRHAAAAMNYRASLIELGHTLERVNSLVDRYTAKKVRERADMIARTEVMTALNDGALDELRQAQDDGLLPADAKKGWMTAPGCCDDCDELDGVEVGLDDEFPDGGGDGPPLHPNCRCAPYAVAP